MIWFCKECGHRTEDSEAKYVFCRYCNELMEVEDG